MSLFVGLLVFFFFWLFSTLCVYSCRRDSTFK